MPRFTHARSLLPALVCAACALFGWVEAVPASATSLESYSELARFGGGGVANGKFELQEWTYAFGVDPEDNGVYVGDEPAEETKSPKYPPGDFRIQKLAANGEFLGAVAFKAKCRQGEGKACVNEEKVASTNVGIQGIVFDTVTNAKSEPERRLYVLSTYERGESLKVDAETVAAADLYAFSTKPKEEGGEKKLEPAVGTAAEGVLAGSETLETDSKVQGQALLNPKGITVDPTTHEVIIAGEVDLGEGNAVTEGKHLALQRVTATGTLGARYVSPVREYGEVEPNSPVVTQAGQVLMQTGSTTFNNDRIIQIPTNFSSTSAPKTVYELDNSEKIIEFGEELGEPHGGGLSVAPESGRTGRLYANASIAPVSSNNAGVLAFAYESKAGEEEVHVSELGWAGGNTEATKKCTLGFEGIIEEPLVAADGEKVFLLEPGGVFGFAVPEVVEYGPASEPKGCPVATATEPVATIEGHTVPKVQVGDGEVALSSSVSGANALSVEWIFGDGSKEIVHVDENQETTVKHAFEKPGTLTVEEIIHTDDLASPTVKKTAKVTAEASAPTARFTASEAGQGEATTFNASTSTDPNGGYGAPLEYTWEFGDGSKAVTTKEPTYAYTYAKRGGYTAKLKVTDAFGLVSKVVEHKVEVGISAQEKKEEQEKKEREARELKETQERQAKEAQEREAKEAQERQAKEAQERQAKEAQEREAREKQEREAKTGVLHSVESAPEATVVGSSFQVSAAGAVSLKISCPKGNASCAGTVTVRTLTAVAAGGKKKAILTLANGGFTVSGGSTGTITLHLSSKARALLAHSHVLRVRATVAAHNASGASHTALATITLRAAKGKH